VNCDVSMRRTEHNDEGSLSLFAGGSLFARESKVQKGDGLTP